MLRVRPLAALALAAAVTVPLLSGCAGDEPTIALLVADGTDTASRAVDVEGFTDRVEATCDGCRVSVYDAEGDAETQTSQAREAEASSADVLVVVPVEATDLETLTAREVPVVSLGELVPASDAFVGLERGQVVRQAGSDLQAARNLVLGDEDAMTYVPTREMTEQAADLAVAYLAGKPLTNGEEVDGVESWLYEAQDVTIDNLTSVLVAQGVVTLDELCEGSTAKDCARLGIR